MFHKKWYFFGQNWPFLGRGAVDKVKKREKAKKKKFFLIQKTGHFSIIYRVFHKKWYFFGQNWPFLGRGAVDKVKKREKTKKKNLKKTKKWAIFP